MSFTMLQFFFLLLFAHNFGPFVCVASHISVVVNDVEDDDDCDGEGINAFVCNDFASHSANKLRLSFLCAWKAANFFSHFKYVLSVYHMESPRSASIE